IGRISRKTLGNPGAAARTHTLKPRPGVETKVVAMLAWLLWQLEGMQRTRAAAGVLMDEFGDEAYAEARRRERQSGRDEMAGVWRRGGLVVARWTPRRVGPDVAPPTLPEPNP